MKNWKHWILPGLVTVVVLTAITAWLRTAPVENDLSIRVSEALKSDHPWASVELNGRDLTLSGIAPGKEQIDNAIETASQTYGVRSVSSRAELPPIAEPFVFSAQRSGSKVILAGNVPGDAERQSIMQAVQGAVPDSEIEDQMTLARGASPDFAIISSYAIVQLAGLDDARVSISGDAVSVRGKALSPQAHKAVSDALSGNLPAGTLETVQISPAPASPYGFEASRSEAGIVLGGYVPSQELRTTIVENVTKTLPGVAIVDNMLPAASAPDSYDKQVQYAVSQLAGLADGSVFITDGALSVEGRAIDFEAFDRFKSLGGNLPAGLQLEATNIAQPEIDKYVWSVESREGAGVTLSGYVPDAETASKNIDLTTDRFGSQIEIFDRQRVVNSAPGGFAQMAEAAIQAASRLSSGKIAISDNEVSLTGIARTGVAANEIRTQLLAGLPQGYESDSEISVQKIDGFVDPAECGNLITKALETNVIRFESGSAAISPASYGLLDTIAFHMRKCPDTRLEVAGHTDGDGDDAANLALSEARAKSVRQYLVRSGIFFSRLDAKGYGESQPIAENTTDADKARNRRIDFSVIQ